MKEIILTPEQIKANQKSELINDLMATATVMEEIWRYHPDNPKKADLVEEYNNLVTIKASIEGELAELGN
tara:strand:- start:486 stop:695 length:210 start_codon:yes stop_codon:yes gene_type:complete